MVYEEIEVYVCPHCKYFLGARIRGELVFYPNKKWLIHHGSWYDIVNKKRMERPVKNQCN